MMKETNTLIIGASVSGLACASTLQKKNIEYLIIDKEDQVAAAWRNHDDPPSFAYQQGFVKFAL